MRIGVLTLVLCATPDLGLRAYLSLGMHGAEAAAMLPARWLLSLLFFLGVPVPIAGSCGPYAG